ncbi:MAG: VCBS repeat-containing protein [Desulfobacterales bacterium]
MLGWNPNPETVEGYRIFSRSAAEPNYDYENPAVVVLSSTCTLEMCTGTVEVPDGVTTYFVVRAYNSSGLESADSAEVPYVPPALPEEPEISETPASESPPQEDLDTAGDTQSDQAEPVAAVSDTSQETSPDTDAVLDIENRLPSAEIFNEDFVHQDWLYIHWIDYIIASGEARVALGDIDGDGKDEIIIGLGPDRDPSIPGGSFQILDHDYSHLAWGRITWSEYNETNGEGYPACGDIDGDGKDEIFIGLGNGGLGQVEIFNFQGGSVVHKGWLKVDWPEYNQILGQTRPASGDIDGDGKDEIIIGLGSDGSDPEMPAGLFLALDNNYSYLAWGEIDWPAYNETNGESFPSTGNLNGDGKEMIVMGLGAEGEGRVALFQFQDGIVSHNNWITVGWEEYNQTVGETRPVCGDIDGDGKDEIIIGLGSNLGNPEVPGGRFPIMDDNLTLLAWSKIDWPDYNTGNGKSYPASGDTDGDGKDEIVIGLGVRSAYASDEKDFLSADSAGESSGGGSCFILSAAVLK